ncbi:hypothetical protein BAUCODRAFT_66325 [Baudoinia panamericana UAMH 10762]|uniref:CST complex subunit STN1 n=1 Tax=Baudoinia panamericana (strain UAMH 10762) TaxID=717646 RepID=M2NHK0_BAUPA|nr:uncharacterized protein BAUCODRAFT_66325 [Baudoinia panamericana UAMH 10762]EMC98495.1 hypothetical protein BAUCODRAFT_66325 [Baudoinia panamericana UAMH 10762]
MSDEVATCTSYPKRYFNASQTWDHWNPLTATDIHALRTESGFEGQKIYFFGYHPIRYTRVVGILVDIELRGRYTILTIDDSSGACIDVKIEARRVTRGDNAECPSNTTVDNVDIHVIIGSGPTIHLHRKPLEIGSVLKVKGTISAFRGVRQIELKRLFTVDDTNAEARAWAETAKWKRDVLAEDWILTRQQQHEIDERCRQEERKAFELSKKRREWHNKYGAAKRTYDEKREARRREKEMRYNAGALKGSHLIPAPWD